MRGFTFGFVLLGMAVGSAAGRNSPSVVEARAVMATDAAYPGSEVKVAVVAQVAAGFHINDHHPSLDYLIPTELKLDGADQIGVESVAYPKGQQQRFAFSETALSVYEGTLVVTAVLRVARSVRLGLHTIRGKFAYQACNDHACFPPETVPLALTVKIVPRSVPLKRQNADVFDKIKLD